MSRRKKAFNVGKQKSIEIRKKRSCDVHVILTTDKDF